MCVLKNNLDCVFMGKTKNKIVYNLFSNKMRLRVHIIEICPSEKKTILFD